MPLCPHQKFVTHIIRILVNPLRLPLLSFNTIGIAHRKELGI